MKPVDLSSEHPLTNPGMGYNDDLITARHFALVAEINGCVFNDKISSIRRRLISHDHVDGIEIHQFIMHAELVLTDEDILMADTLLAALGVGPSGDVPIAGSGLISEEAFQKLKQNPRFEARLNPDDPLQVGIIKLDTGRCVKIQRRSCDAPSQVST